VCLNLEGAQSSSSFSHFAVNTFVLWANVNSSDLQYALHTPKGLSVAECFPPTEPTIFYDGTSTLTLAFGCLSPPGLPAVVWKTRVATSTHPLFLPSANFSDVGVDGNSPCAGKTGYQSPSLLRFGGQMYLSVSPSASGGAYGGCELWAFDMRKLVTANSTPVKSLMSQRYHSGSCTGGDGTFLAQDKAANDAVLFFYAPLPGSFYQLHQVNFTSI
jgi:hypothetical protein